MGRLCSPTLHSHRDLWVFVLITLSCCLGCPTWMGVGGGLSSSVLCHTHTRCSQQSEKRASSFSFPPFYPSTRSHHPANSRWREIPRDVLRRVKGINAMTRDLSCDKWWFRRKLMVGFLFVFFCFFSFLNVFKRLKTFLNVFFCFFLFFFVFFRFFFVFKRF